MAGLAGVGELADLQRQWRHWRWLWPQAVLAAAAQLLGVAVGAQGEVEAAVAGLAAAAAAPGLDAHVLAVAAAGAHC